MCYYYFYKHSMLIFHNFLYLGLVTEGVIHHSSPDHVGVVTECCQNSCSESTLRSYCADDNFFMETVFFYLSRYVHWTKNLYKVHVRAKCSWSPLWCTHTCSCDNFHNSYSLLNRPARFNFRISRDWKKIEIFGPRCGHLFMLNTAIEVE